MNILQSKLSGLIGFGIVIVCWYAISASRIFLPILIPDPTSVFSTIYFAFTTGKMTEDLALTLYRTATSFAFSAAIGVPVGLILGYSQTAYRVFQPAVDFYRSIPATALFPLFILFFGINDSSVFASVVFGNVFLIILNAMYGVHNANKARILFTKTLNASQAQIFFKVVFYEALPYIFVGLRQALSISLIIVIVTEMFFGSANGLGYRIFNYNLLYKSPEMYGVIIIVGIMGYLLNQGFVFFEKRMVHWAGR